MASAPSAQKPRLALLTVATDPLRHSVPADLRKKADELGVTIYELYDHVMCAGFEPSPPPEIDELVEEFHQFTMSQIPKKNGDVCVESSDDDDEDGGDDYAEHDEPKATETGTRVFAIPELFDHISSYLSAPDLVRCRRVSRQFHHNVSSSSILQRRLFLKAAPSQHDPEINELGPRCIKWTSKSTATKPNDDHVIEGSINVFSINRIKRALRGGTLWEKMFVSQPPMKAMELYYGRGREMRVLRRKAGITFSDLFREAEEMVRVAPQEMKPRSPAEEDEAYIWLSWPVEEKKMRKKRAAESKTVKAASSRPARAPVVQTTPNFWVRSLRSQMERSRDTLLKQLRPVIMPERMAKRHR